MLYVVVDPCQTYPLYMMAFLAKHGLGAIAVFTQAGAYHAFHNFFSEEAGQYLADEYLCEEFETTEQLAAQIRHDHSEELQGIIPWDELTIRYGAELSAALGIDWNSQEVIRRFRDKFAMKEALRRAETVRINKSQVVQSLRQALSFQSQVSAWPIVVKPTEGAGSMGVRFAHSPGELQEAAEEVFRRGMGEILLEEYIDGLEYVVNGITNAEGQLLVTDVWVYDKRTVGQFDNIYYQTIKVNQDDAVWWPLVQYATDVVHALGLRKAPVHMEVKIDHKGPCLIEVGARFAGGDQPLLASKLHGRSLFELAACHYIADLPLKWEDLNYDHYNNAHARIISGVQTEALQRLHAIEGIDEVQSLPSFFQFGKLMNVGDFVPITHDLLSRPWTVYLFHEDSEQVIHDAKAIRSLLRYV